MRYRKMKPYNARARATHGETVTVSIPAGTIIEANGYYVFSRGSQWFDNDDEAIILRDAEGNQVDRTPALSDDDNDDWCWLRYPNGLDTDSYTDWRFQTSTMGASNGGEPSPPIPEPEPEPEPEQDPEPEFPPLPPLPPILSNLTITPAELKSGDEVTIGLDIDNIDSQSFTYIATMQIGELTLLIDVELEAYESKTVSRTITQDIPGEYNVTVNGLTGNFTVKAPPKPAEFEFSSLRIFYPGVIPPEVDAGQP